MKLQSSVKRWGESFFYFVLRTHLNGYTSVLDVGCGSNSALQFVRLPMYKVGIDLYKKSVNVSKQKHIHDDYVIGDVRTLSKFFKRKSFDAVICIDVIEHLTTSEGLQLVKQMELIARRRVIFLTPNGFYHQHALEGNPHQVHKSGWRSALFRKMGYRVRGLRGLRILRDDHASIKLRPWFFWGAITFISEILFYPFPELCFDIIATKTLS